MPLSSRGQGAGGQGEVAQRAGQGLPVAAQEALAQAVEQVEAAAAGGTRVGGKRPPTGSQPSHTANTSCTSIAAQKGAGRRCPRHRAGPPDRFSLRSGDAGEAHRQAHQGRQQQGGDAQLRLAGRLWPMIRATGSWLLSDSPRSPRSRLPRNWPYCSNRLRSRPSWLRRAARAASGARVPSTASTGSPGATRSSRNTRLAISQSITGTRARRAAR